MPTGSARTPFAWGAVIAIVILGTVAWNIFPLIARRAANPTPHFDGLGRAEAVTMAAAVCDSDEPSAVRDAARSLKLDELRPDEAERHGGDDKTSVWRVPKHASMYVRLTTIPGNSPETTSTISCAVLAADVNVAELLGRLRASDVRGAPRDTIEPGGGVLYEWPLGENGAVVRLHAMGESVAQGRDIELEFVTQPAEAAPPEER